MIATKACLVRDSTEEHKIGRLTAVPRNGLFAVGMKQGWVDEQYISVELHCQAFLLQGHTVN